MYLAPLNYDRFFKKVFSHLNISKVFLEDFLEVEIDEIELLETTQFLTHDATKVSFDFRCKIGDQYIIIDMQQWYKPDVVKRFYLYHCGSTVLQLEFLPQKKLPSANEKDKRATGVDYRNVVPVLTLIWMVDDTLGFTENMVSYTNAPEELISFAKDEKLWNKKHIDEIVEKRNETLKILNNKHKGLDFLQQNRLVFLFQSNIVKSTQFKKYYRWFDFAEKTRNSDNEKMDFDSYREDLTFKEIMRLIAKDGLVEDDFSYIEDEQENLVLVERALNDWWEEGHSEGKLVGREEGRLEGKLEGRLEGKLEGRMEGIVEGIAEGEARKEKELILNLYSKGQSIEFIAELLGISTEKIKAIIARE